MITRIVKLSFTSNYASEFELQFPAIRKIVESSEGCHLVQLQKATDNVYFTISKWDNEKALNNYRESSVFREIWSTFKTNFKEKAVAWTTEELHQRSFT